MTALYAIQVPSKCRFDLIRITLEHIRDSKPTKKLARTIKQGPRQAHFMCQNCCILGFAERDGSDLIITDKGQKFLVSDCYNQGLMVAQSALESPIISSIVKFAGSLEEASKMSNEDITEFLVESILVSANRTAPIEAVTARRRASSLKKWLVWLVKNIPTVSENNSVDDIDDTQDLLSFYD